MLINRRPRGGWSSPPPSVLGTAFLSGALRLPLPEKALADVFLIKRREKHVVDVGVGVRGREKEGQREVSCAGLAGTLCYLLNLCVFLTP